ncbi:ATP-binding protein [Streptomyces olivochromogenes]|uniref:histidine kinase n=1 Tax=Streptomyces olivochromogenes TaxID=1963 RepID=A0A250VPH3_STROL|nr:ATP-binding protein [Streptomyces olivochromogenes]GAX56097.1 sensor histidine kinase [Streptomyces olivochromogenes]
MTERIPEAAFWCLAVGLLAVIVLLVRQRGITGRQRGRSAELADALRARDEELRHLVAVRLPALESAPHQPASTTGHSLSASGQSLPSPGQPLPAAGASLTAPALPAVGLLDARLADTDFAKCLDGLLERFSDAVRHAQTRADQSAKAALKASMRSIQALANEQQVSISEMQDRHDHPDVLRDLLEIDHTNAQFGRRAQAIAVLCGSWPGRQRAASPLIEVVRGATSRIRDYRRIRINGQADIAVESRAVEPVVLAVAELLDNAARHSQPNTTVEVSVQAVHNGAVVVIDDAGVGMDSRGSEHAAALLTGRRAVDVTRLDDPPQFGFAVIGVLATRYGFNVSVDTRSPYGGVRAVVFVPAALLTHADPVQEPPPPREPARTPRRTARTSGPAQATTAGGLPKRRRRAPVSPPAAEQPPAATGAPAAPAAPAEESAGRSAEENARRMGAFARGTRSARAERDTAPSSPTAAGTPHDIEAPHESEGNTQG